MESLGESKMSITETYWNVIQELQERLNFYEEKYASHITKVLPSGIIEYEINTNCVNAYDVKENK